MSHELGWELHLEIDGDLQRSVSAARRTKSWTRWKMEDRYDRKGLGVTLGCGGFFEY